MRFSLIAGHTYEKDSVLRFWATRPLANPIGSGNAPPLRSAQMIINYGMRAMVSDWLAKQPEGYVPSGWEDPRLDGRRRRRATQEELDSLAASVEAAAAARAAEAEEERRQAEAAEEEEAAAMLAFAADRLVLSGELPPECACVREYLGVYERVHGRLVNGRHVYAQIREREGKHGSGSSRGSSSGGDGGGGGGSSGGGSSSCADAMDGLGTMMATTTTIGGSVGRSSSSSCSVSFSSPTTVRASARRMLWYADATRFWHFGPAAYVGQPCGHGACYGSGADRALPERLPTGHWMVCQADSSWVQAAALRCWNANAGPSGEAEGSESGAAARTVDALRQHHDLQEAMRIGEGDLLLL